MERWKERMSLMASCWHLKEVKFFLPLPPGLEAKTAVYLEENRNQDLKK